MNLLLVSFPINKILTLKLLKLNMVQKPTWSTESTVQAALVANLIPQNLVM